MEEYYKRLFQSITLVSSIVFIFFLIAAGIKESRPQWKTYQERYQEISIKASENEAQIAAAQAMQPGIRQTSIEEINRLDRCATCHLGINDSRMVDQVQPFRTHSGEHIKNHPLSEYGCTVCHDGQGQAIDKRSAHARAHDVDWPYPLRSLRYVESACGQCHLAIFESTPSLPGTDVFKKGLFVFRREGCLGCHKARGVGGIIGPDLTEQGRKTWRDYNFAFITGEQTVVNWLYEHFKDPEMVFPGSQMLALELDESEIQALITFTLGLTKPDLPFEYFSIETLQEFKGQRTSLSGTQAYPMICSACHGESGEGKNYQDYKTGIPAISNPDFLKVASSDFIAFSIYYGRSGRQMAAWLPRFSGLRPEELDALADYLKSQRIIRSDFDSVSRIQGTVSQGTILYQENCSMCHGEDGKGAQIITISNPDFLAVASDEFLYATLANGRANTAMPGWGNFSSENMADILVRLRNWQQVPRRRGTFLAEIGNSKSGADKYHYLCSRCHGIYGQGDTGPALFNVNLMETATDYFLSEIIARGRRGTAMLGWSTAVSPSERISNQDIADVIVFLRQSAAYPPEVFYPGPSLGAAEPGMTSFRRSCAECHGSDGEGNKAPALNNQELLNAGTNGYLYATISLGRNGTQMPSWGRGSDSRPALSSQERHDIVAFLRQWQQVVIKKRVVKAP